MKYLNPSFGNTLLLIHQ